MTDIVETEVESLRLTVERLRARVAVLEAALRRLADLSDNIGAKSGANQWATLRDASFAARAALAPQEGEP